MKLQVFSAITSRALSISLVSGAVLFTNSAAQAKIINGDFEQSFDGWTTSGDVTVNGISQASLATASSETSDVFTLETFLGLEPGQLTPSVMEKVKCLAQQSSESPVCLSPDSSKVSVEG